MMGEVCRKEKKKETRGEKVPLSEDVPRSTWLHCFTDRLTD